jgi:hypothetical protein
MSDAVRVQRLECELLAAQHRVRQLEEEVFTLTSRLERRTYSAGWRPGDPEPEGGVSLLQALLDEPVRSTDE